MKKSENQIYLVAGLSTVVWLVLLFLGGKIVAGITFLAFIGLVVFCVRRYLQAERRDV
jgi:Flp pilus assembly protein TadB